MLARSIGECFRQFCCLFRGLDFRLDSLVLFAKEAHEGNLLSTGFSLPPWWDVKVLQCKMISGFWACPKKMLPYEYYRSACRCSQSRQHSLLPGRFSLFDF